MQKSQTIIDGHGCSYLCVKKCVTDYNRSLQEFFSKSVQKSSVNLIGSLTTIAKFWFHMSLIGQVGQINVKER